MKERNSNFELMRIISMLFIVIGHTLSWGGVTSSTDGVLKLIIYIVYSLIAVHVNSFVLLTGYYQIQSKFKIRKILNLIFLMILYRVVFCLLGMSIGWLEYGGFKDLLLKLLPLSNFSYWYLNVYMVLYLISPYLNKLINYIDRRKYCILLVILFIFCSIATRMTMQEFLSNSDGYSLVQFIFMYLIGGYIRKYDGRIKFKILNKKISINNKASIFFVIYFILGIGKFLLNYMGTKSSNIEFIPEFVATRLSYSFDRLIYDDPLVILQSIAYFLMFKNIKLKNKFINILSKGTNEVYLFHMNNSIRNNLYIYLGINLNYYRMINIPKIILVIFEIYFIGITIYFIRIFIFKLLLKNKYINKINIMINKKEKIIDEIMNN